MQEALNTKQPIELSLILPVLGKGICLKDLLKLLIIDIEVPYEIIIIYQPLELSSALVNLISKKYPAVHWLEKNSGGGTLGALQQGIRAASGEYILVVCADTVGPLIAVRQMLELVHEGCDFVSGTRYAGGGRRLGGPLLEVTLSRVANYLLYSLAGWAFTDCTTGLKLFRKSVFNKLSLQSQSEGWVVAFEMALKSQLAQLKIGEVGNIAVDHLYGGDSTCSFDKEFFEYFKWFIWGLINLRAIKVNHSNVPIRRIQIAN